MYAMRCDASTSLGFQAHAHLHPTALAAMAGIPHTSVVEDVQAEVLVSVRLPDESQSSLEKSRRGPPTFLTARTREGETATATGYEEVHHTNAFSST